MLFLISAGRSSSGNDSAFSSTIAVQGTRVVCDSVEKVGGVIPELAGRTSKVLSHLAYILSGLAHAPQHYSNSP